MNDQLHRPHVLDVVHRLARLDAHPALDGERPGDELGDEQQDDAAVQQHDAAAR